MCHDHDIESLAILIIGQLKSIADVPTPADWWKFTRSGVVKDATDRYFLSNGELQWCAWNDKKEMRTIRNKKGKLTFTIPPSYSRASLMMASNNVISMGNIPCDSKIWQTLFCHSAWGMPSLKTNAALSPSNNSPTLLFLAPLYLSFHWRRRLSYARRRMVS
jgi:hypothetical protein